MQTKMKDFNINFTQYKCGEIITGTIVMLTKRGAVVNIGGMKDVYRYKGNDMWEDAYGYWETTEDEGITHWMELPPDPEFWGEDMSNLLHYEELMDASNYYIQASDMRSLNTFIGELKV